MECSLELISNSEDKCAFVNENCQSSYFSPLALHYCFLQNSLFSLSFIVFAVIVAFYLTSKVANRYLSNAITTLTEQLKMKENFAGVTLVAFGNGAPDVIVSLLASDSAEGIDFALSTLIGGTISVGILTFSVVLIKGKQIKVPKNPFNRDIIFFLISITALYLLFLIGSVNLIGSLLFFSIYLVFIAIAYRDNAAEEPSVRETGNMIELSSDTSIDKVSINITTMPSKKTSVFKKVYQTIFKALDFPFDFLFKITIPDTDSTKWNRQILVIMPFLTYVSMTLCSLSTNISRTAFNPGY